MLNSGLKGKVKMSKLKKLICCMGVAKGFRQYVTIELLALRSDEEQRKVALTLIHEACDVIDVETKRLQKALDIAMSVVYKEKAAVLFKQCHTCGGSQEPKETYEQVVNRGIEFRFNRNRKSQEPECLICKERRSCGVGEKCSACRSQEPAEKCLNCGNKSSITCNYCEDYKYNSQEPDSVVEDARMKVLEKCHLSKGMNAVMKNGRASVESQRKK